MPECAPSLLKPVGSRIVLQLRHVGVEVALASRWILRPADVRESEAGLVGVAASLALGLARDSSRGREILLVERDLRVVNVVLRLG